MLHLFTPRTSLHLVEQIVLYSREAEAMLNVNTALATVAYSKALHSLRTFQQIHKSEFLISIEEDLIKKSKMRFVTLNPKANYLLLYQPTEDVHDMKLFHTVDSVRQISAQGWHFKLAFLYL